MKKSLLALSLLAMSASAHCDVCTAVAEATSSMYDEDCLLSEMVCQPFYDDNDKYGIKDKEGNVVVPAIYDDINHAYDVDYNRVPYLAIKSENNRYGLMNDKGKVVLAPDYDELRFTKNNLVIVEKHGMYGVMDLAGKVVLPIAYHEISVNDAGMAVAQTRSYTVFDPQGKSIATYPVAHTLDNGAMSFCQIDHQDGTGCGVMNEAGKVVIPLKYRYVQAMNNYSGEDDVSALVKVVNKQNKVALFDVNTGKALTPFIYDGMDYYASEGMIGVEVEGKYGFIDKTGKQMIAPTYDYASYFDVGLVKVEKDGERFYIDKTGKRVP